MANMSTYNSMLKIVCLAWANAQTRKVGLLARVEMFIQIGGDDIAAAHKANFNHQLN